MPDFFLISGLFLANVIDRDWRTYLDRKVVHFFYFYLLWMTIQFAVKAPEMAADRGTGGRAALPVVRSSSISPSSCRWRRRARCCSRCICSPISARCRSSLPPPASSGVRLVLGHARHLGEVPVRASGDLLADAHTRAKAKAGPAAGGISPQPRARTLIKRG
jgi:hypothetical protein